MYTVPCNAPKCHATKVRMHPPNIRSQAAYTSVLHVLECFANRPLSSQLLACSQSLTSPRVTPYLGRYLWVGRKFFINALDWTEQRVHQPQYYDKPLPQSSQVSWWTLQRSASGLHYGYTSSRLMTRGYICGHSGVWMCLSESVVDSAVQEQWNHLMKDS